MLTKKVYILKRSFEQFRIHKKINAMLILSIFFGMIVPIFIIGNVNKLKEQVDDYFFSNVETTQILETNSNEVLGNSFFSDLIKPNFQYTYEIINFEDIPQIKKTSTVKGIDNKFKKFFSIDTVEGRMINLERMECLVDSRLMKEEHLKIGDRITISGENFSIVGKTDSSNYQICVPATIYGDLLKKKNFPSQQIVYVRCSEKKAKIYLNEISKKIDTNTFFIRNPVKIAKENKKVLSKYIHIEMVIAIVTTLFVLLNLFIVLQEKLGFQLRFYAISQALGLSLTDIALMIFFENLLAGIISGGLLFGFFEMLRRYSGIWRYLSIQTEDILLISFLILLIAALSSGFSIMQLKKIPIAKIINNKELA